MNFEEALTSVSSRVRTYGPKLQNEEATKTALILPFLSEVLGYDIYNPEEVVPEFTCDVGVKRGEKVDYAICKDEEVLILIEAKSITAPLKLEHASQLVRYFSVADARIGVLTNGQVWEFYTDLDKPNVMDSIPFLRVDLLDLNSSPSQELKKLSKEDFDIEAVVASAEELKYVSALKREFLAELDRPSDELVKLLAKRVYSGTLTSSRLENFTQLLEKAMRSTVAERVNARLKAALRDTSGEGPDTLVLETDSQSTGDAGKEAKSAEEDNGGVNTTAEELQGFYIIRSLMAPEVPFARVVAHDRPGYFALLIDGNKRKTFGRLHFEGRSLSFALPQSDKSWKRYPIAAPEDLFTFRDEIREAFHRIDSPSEDQLSLEGTSEVEEASADAVETPVAPDYVPHSWR